MAGVGQGCVAGRAVRRRVEVRAGYGQGLTVTWGSMLRRAPGSTGGPPTGLFRHASVGSIFGTPTSSGTFSFTVTVKDSSNPQMTASQTLSISVAAAVPALSIGTTSLPGATVGTGYGQGVTATGGQTPYTWTVSSGGLPPGLDLNASAGPILGSVGLLILLGLAGCLIAVRRITSVDPIVALRARN